MEKPSLGAESICNMTNVEISGAPLEIHPRQKQNGFVFSFLYISIKDVT
jgi:hypothetical protein